MWTANIGCVLVRDSPRSHAVRICVCLEAAHFQVSADAQKPTFIIRQPRCWPLALAHDIYEHCGSFEVYPAIAAPPHEQATSTRPRIHSCSDLLPPAAPRMDPQKGSLQGRPQSRTHDQYCNRMPNAAEVEVLLHERPLRLRIKIRSGKDVYPCLENLR